MAIIRYTKDATIRYAYLNIYPDQFKTEKEKEDKRPGKKVLPPKKKVFKKKASVADATIIEENV